MTNENVTAGRLAELGGATNSGLKIGFVDSGAKAAQNDTWTVKNAKEVLYAAVFTLISSAERLLENNRKVKIKIRTFFI